MLSTLRNNGGHSLPILGIFIDYTLGFLNLKQKTPRKLFQLLFNKKTLYS